MGRQVQLVVQLADQGALTRAIISNNAHGFTLSHFKINLLQCPMIMMTIPPSNQFEQAVSW
jgi:capsid protein